MLFIEIYLVFQLFLVAIFALCIGSFINMAIYRVHKHKNFYGSSFCDFCKKPLKIVDLIPLFSFISTKGKSRCCSKKLDITMPVVESISAISYLILGYFYFFNSLDLLSVIYISILIPILLFIFFYDLKYSEIPVFPVVVGYLSWVIYKIYQSYLIITDYKLQISGSPISKNLLESGLLENKIQYIKEDILWTIGFAFLVFLFFYFLYLVTNKQGMGFGDVYFAPLLALLIEYPHSPIFLSASFITGAIFGVILIIFKGKNMKTAVPFGPFLIIGLCIALTFKLFFITL